ncbi:MAG: hypothetical protein NC320_13160 [Clostridium sp.]|nr:hypothetical protein [Clostridium sp.]
MKNNFKFTDNSNEAISKLNELKKQAEQKHAFNEILTDSFVKSNTKFDSYEDLMKKIESVSPEFELNSKVDELISKNSNFNSYQEMVFTALGVLE